MNTLSMKKRLTNLAPDRVVLALHDNGRQGLPGEHPQRRRDDCARPLD